MEFIAKAVSQRPVYKVTQSVPGILSDETVGLTPRHLVVVHDLSDVKFEIRTPAIAKLSLYKLSDVSIVIASRVVSSSIEISQCTNLTIHLEEDDTGNFPSVIQIDPEIHGMHIKFITKTNPDPATSLIVAPRPLHLNADLGLVDVNVIVDEKSATLIDRNGTIHDDLLRGIGGNNQAEQFKITLVEDWDGGERKRWTMTALSKEKGYTVIQ